MSDELLEKLGNDFIDNNIRELTGITFLQYITDPESYKTNIEKKIQLHDLGLTDHEDLGVHGEYYHEVIEIWPFQKTIRIKKTLVNDNDDRYKMLMSNIKSLRKKINRHDFSRIELSKDFRV